jgi:uncharacterized protein (DUF362 family)/NAD-dependent dihydropyrimidine dehydrogenase PreA subunit
MNTQVSIVKCKDYDPGQVQGCVRRSIDLLGGVTNFIKPGSKVLVKPNLLMAKEPESGIVTHPEILRAVIIILKEINCKVLVGDGPSVWGNQIEDVSDVYRLSKVSKVCEEEGVELVRFDKRRMRKKFPLTTYLDECDHLVSIPKFKTHEFTLLTGAIKNLFGLVSGTYKTELHKNYFDIRDFSKILVDILEEAKPSLTIVDGILAMEGDGPATSGKKKDLGLILAGQDCVAIDAVMAKIMNIEPFDVLSTKEAASRGLGAGGINSIEILGEKLNGIIEKSFLLPSSSIIRKKMPKAIIALVKKFVRYYPYPIPEKCIKCAACVKICPNNCISMSKKGIVFNYKKCIACFCCQEACPAAAIGVRKSLLAKVIGL